MKENNNGKGPLQNLALITQLGISMVTPILLGVYIGTWLDKKIGTTSIFTLVFLFLGIGGGFMSLFKITGAFKNKRK